MITVTLQKRKTDSYGSGAFMASRGSRSHKGIDYACWPGSLIQSPISGQVTKLGYAYADDLSYRYVEITDDKQARHRFFYVSPQVIDGQMVEKGDYIGQCQDIAERYNKGGMTPHCHYEILVDNVPVNPEEYQYE